METEEHFRNQQDTEQVFIDREEKEFHRVVCKIGEGATSEAFKVVDTRTGRAMCKKILKDAGDHNFKNMRNSMKEICLRYDYFLKKLGCKFFDVLSICKTKNKPFKIKVGVLIGKNFQPKPSKS